LVELLVLFQTELKSFQAWLESQLKSSQAQAKSEIKETHLCDTAEVVTACTSEPTAVADRTPPEERLQQCIHFINSSKLEW